MDLWKIIIFTMNIYCKFVTCLLVAAYNPICAHFEFTSVSGTILEGSEGTTLNVTFILNITTKKCSNVCEIFIDKNVTPFCKIRLHSDSCIGTPTNSICGCLTVKGGFWFAKVLDQSDNTTWKLRALDEKLTQVAVQNFAITVKDKCQSDAICPLSETDVVVSWVSGSTILAVAVLGVIGAIYFKRRLTVKNNNGCEFLESSQYEQNNALNESEGVIHINTIYGRSLDMHIAAPAGEFPASSQYEQDNAVNANEGVIYINNANGRSCEMHITTPDDGATDVYVDVAIGKEKTDVIPWN